MARPVPLPTDPDRREWALRSELKGKTLMGEVHFAQEECDVTARFFAAVIARRGTDPGRRMIVESWPIMFALWLTNEAFFNFVGAKYWPFVLNKIGIDNHNAYSSRFGSDFLRVLDRFQLPRFRRLKTRWSYLGPILAHSGIPRSCLPEYFDKVVPRAIELGASSRSGLERLRESLPALHLPRATEWFVLFGDAVAEDFVRRSAELFRAKADRQETTFAAERLPQRVVDAFEVWWASEPSARRAASTGPRPRRPVLTFDPLDGLRLSLPSQVCTQAHEGVTWRVQADRSAPHDIPARRLPGESQTEPREQMLPEPFGTLTVRLIEGTSENGLWTFAGVTQDQPVLFFDSDLGRVLPRSSLDASVLGVVHPSDTHLVGFREDERTRPRVVTNIAQLRFGWRSFQATVIDCTGSDELGIRSTNGDTLWRSELRDIGGRRPRLLPGAGEVTRSRDGLLVFDGAAPVLGLASHPGESPEDTLRRWAVRIRPFAEGGSAGDVLHLGLDATGVVWEEGDDQSLRVPLGQDRLLGTRPWGVFDLSLLGPLGRDASFRFTVRPKVAVAHRWKSWRQDDELDVELRVPPATRLIGALPTEDPRVFLKRTTGHPINLTLVATGYGDVEWQMPLDLQVPLPSWSLYDPERHTPLLDWTTKSLRVSLGELDGNGGALLLKGATPVGIPTGLDVVLRTSAGSLVEKAVQPDEQGYASIDLTPFLAAARQTQAARLDLDVTLRLPLQRVPLRVVQFGREWQPERITATVRPAVIEVKWEERFAVESRAVQVTNLLQPWVAPTVVAMAPSDRGGVNLDRDGFAPAPYRVTLGIHDDWTGQFKPQGAVDVELGDPRQWQADALWSGSSVEASLYRLLLADRAAALGVDISITGDDGTRIGTGSAEKVLRACLALGAGRQSDRTANRLSRLLLQAPLEETLQAIAHLESVIRPDVVLRLRLLTRSTRMSDAGMDASVGESLWRIWAPLGAWADLRALRANQPDAEERLEQAFGSETLQALSPIVERARVRLFGVIPDAPFKCRLVRVLPGSGQSAFSIRRLEPPAVLVVESDMPAVPKTVLSLSRTEHGWAVQSAGEEPLPEPLASAATRERELSVVVYYPRHPPLCRRAPEPQIIDIVKRGQAPVLRAQLEMCSPLPSGPIGGDAFLAACFEWAEAAASDRTVMARLTDMCSRIAIPRAKEASAKLREQDGAFHSGEAADRIIAELMSRGDHRVDFEPLLAVHQLTWLTAMSLVWRGLDRTLPYMWSEADLIDTALRLMECAPRLLEHDLAKVCAIEALAAARRQEPNTHQPEPDGEDHAS